MFKNKGFSVIALIIILAVLGIGGYAVWKKQAVTPPSALPEARPYESTFGRGEGTLTSPLGGGLEGVVPTDWKTYRNDKYWFEFKYPADWLLNTESNKISISKDGYSFTNYYPEAWSPSICEFKSDKYTEINNDADLFRRDNIPNSYGVKKTWVICEKEKGAGSFTQYSGIGSMYYEGPTNYDENTLKIMDKILSTFRFIK